MICAWKELLSVLPMWLSRELDKYSCEPLQELRLRLGMPPQLMLLNRSQWLSRPVSAEDIHFCINTASRYSPWAAIRLRMVISPHPVGTELAFAVMRSFTTE